MTPNQLQACAKFLGESHIGLLDAKLSDAELFYALLLKAEDKGLQPDINNYKSTDDLILGTWCANIYPGDTFIERFGPTALDALAAAIEKLEQESGHAKD